MITKGSTVYSFGIIDYSLREDQDAGRNFTAHSSGHLSLVLRQPSATTFRSQSLGARALSKLPWSTGVCVDF